MKHNYANTLLACALILSSSLFAQKVILLNNPSFESEAPNINTTPAGWGSFAEEKGRYPDLLPGDYAVNASPQDGKTFVGLSSRPYQEYEGIGQTLSQPLEKDSIYTFSIWLAHASKYIVPSFKKGKQNGTKTCNGISSLRILGVNSKSRLNEVLVETEPIEHDEWRKYSFRLNPQAIDCDQIIFSTGSSTVVVPYLGNLLIDNCSEIKMLHWGDPGFVVPLDFSSITASTVIETASFGADQIQLKSPSFEQAIDKLHPDPAFWDNLGPKNQSPPDIQPGRYSVTKAPHHGRQYLGMVTRGNGTREAIGQPLSKKMNAGVGYSFSVWLARSSEYVSTFMPSYIEPPSSPILLQIWGVNSKNLEVELLATSKAVDHEQWQQYHFTLSPTQHDLDYFVLEAWYDPAQEKPYRGNLLVDNCSAILPIKD